MMRLSSELREKFQNSSKCSSRSTSQLNTTANCSCKNLTDTITSLPHLTWNFSPCTNKSFQPKEKKSDSKPTDLDLVLKNSNPLTKKSKKWKFNSDKCSLNSKRKTKKSQNSLSVSPEIKKMPKNSKRSSLKKKKRPLRNPIVPKTLPTRLNSNVLMHKRCWMRLFKRWRNSRRSIWTKSDHSTTHHLPSLRCVLVWSFFSGTGSWQTEVKSYMKSPFLDKQVKKRRTSSKWQRDS